MVPVVCTAARAMAAGPAQLHSTYFWPKLASVGERCTHQIHIDSKQPSKIQFCNSSASGLLWNLARQCVPVRDDHVSRCQGHASHETPEEQDRVSKMEGRIRRCRKCTVQKIGKAARKEATKNSTSTGRFVAQGKP